MSTETMNIALPEEMKSFVSTEVKEGGYNSASEYVRALIREQKQRKEQQKLEQLLLDGLKSGKPGEMSKKDWDAIRQHVLSKKAR